MDEMSVELERLRAALTASGDIVYDWDLVDDRISWLQGSEDGLAVAIAGQMTTGEAFHDHIHPDDLNCRLKATTALYEGGKSFECEYRLRDAGGEHRWCHDRGVAEFGADGKPLRLRGAIRKINREMENNERVAYLANYDELTGHYNRSRLRESLDQALYYSSRYRVSGAFLVIGIDNINMVNQAFGYEVADAVIASVGHRLDRCLRACDVIGRLGGDKFGVVLSNCPADDLHIAAEKILEVARDTEIETLAGPIHVTVSVGAVTFPESAQSASDAVTKAEIALQNAKRAGRNTWSVYKYTDAQRDGHRKNMVIAEQVSRALRENRLVLAFQPIVNTDNLETAMHECLLRMIQPDGTIVQAYEFMPVVEELGLIRLIDRRVLELAHKVLLDHPDIHLAVNVSGLTASDKGWLRQIVGLLGDQPDVARRLTIEITETASLEDVEDCARFVSTLKKMGCLVALDDFGAGYTSFRHLKILSVDMVKIDGSFIRDLPDNPANLIFIRSLLDLARNFNLDTVAECVENEEQTRMLKEEGVRYLQGYAFGKPVIQPDWKLTDTDNQPLATPAQLVAR